MAESKHSRCHGNMADVAISIMEPDLQMGYIIFLSGWSVNSLLLMMPNNCHKTMFV